MDCCDNRHLFVQYNFPQTMHRLWTCAITERAYPQPDVEGCHKTLGPQVPSHRVLGPQVPSVCVLGPQVPSVIVL